MNNSNKSLSDLFKGKLKMMVCQKNPKDFVLQENHWIKKKDFVHTSHSYHLQVIIKNKRKSNDLILFVLDVLNLLEKKKKLVKKNGLLQFVLWREAYRLEISRNCS